MRKRFYSGKGSGIWRRPSRFGSPQLGALLRQELGAINHKRVEQLYAQEGLQLPKRRT